MSTQASSPANRLTQTLGAMGKNQRKVLSLFITAGILESDETAILIRELAETGADLIELGIPFSDPIADGPTIQEGSGIALRNGMTLRKTFMMAADIRTLSNIPLVLMGYANPIYSFGMESFLNHCTSNGIDGTIIADLPPEESVEYKRIAGTNNIATIYLAAPTTSDERLMKLDAASTGFLYCVSITGVTGARAGVREQTTAFLARARRCVTNNPLLVGFGIASPEDALAAAAQSDGVIVGSALIKILLTSPTRRERLTNAVTFVRGLRRALDERER